MHWRQETATYLTDGLSCSDSPTGLLLPPTSREAVRVLETSHPPGYYLPRAAFAQGVLVEAPGCSVCEFKGTGSYLDERVGDTVARRAAWYYPEPWPGYEQLRDKVALYPGAMDSCEVNGEHVIPQEGGLLRGLDHLTGGRPVQGDSRDPRLVIDATQGGRVQRRLICPTQR